MVTLHADADMAAQLERTLIGAYVGSADLGEAIATAGRVAPGEYGQWHEEWAHTAAVALAAADDAAARGHEPTAARGYLRSAEYWRQAYFFLRHDLADDRVITGYQRQRAAFRQAAPFLPFRVEALSIPFTPVPMPGYLFRPARGDADPRPTVLFPGGFDGTAEELCKYGVQAALEAGWNAVAWDGPGQGGMLVEHGLPMRPDFETVLAPVVDWALRQPFVDSGRLLLVGRSLGGYLAPRGASGDQRITALVCDPGQYDFTSRFISMFSEQDWQKVLDGDPDMDAGLEGFLSKPRDREFYGSRMAAMGAATFGEWLRILAGYTLAGRAEKITCPTLITEGEGDFAGQSTALFDALTCEKHFREFTASEGGGGHCEGMGQRLWQQAVFGWLGEIVARI
jgi:pimeloyl-ACP methyl ester carboxylesterase